MDLNEAKAVLDEAQYWHYRFQFPWRETIPTRPGWAERVEKRRRHFFEPLLAHYHGSLSGKRVLDLGCCQGYWSFLSRASGAQSVLGIDSSPSFIREAQAAAVALGVHYCGFHWAHLEDDVWWDLDVDRDITLLLGTLYHLTDPIYVLRRAMSFTKETIVLDGEVIPGTDPSFRLVKRTPGEPTTIRSGMTSDLRTIGTVSALVAILKDGGFSNITVLPPAAEMPADYHAGTTASIIAHR